MSLHTIVTSQFIRTAMADKGFTLPRSPNTIRRTILDHCDGLKSAVKDELLALCADRCGARLSIPLDEWTSSQNRRYINVNLHGAERFWNLGLMRAKGSIAAERTREFVRTKLESFGMRFDDARSDFVCATRDGASVMVAFGSKIAAEHVACYAHVLHLAVQDVFYKPVGAVNEALPVAADHGYALGRENDTDAGEEHEDYAEDDDVVPDRAPAQGDRRQGTQTGCTYSPQSSQGIHPPAVQWQGILPDS